MWRRIRSRPSAVICKVVDWRELPSTDSIRTLADMAIFLLCFRLLVSSQLFPGKRRKLLC